MLVVQTGDGGMLGKSDGEGEGEAVSIADAKVSKREFPSETNGTCVGALAYGSRLQCWRHCR